MTDEAAAKVVKRFSKTSGELYDAEADVKTWASSISDGCGEFATAVSTGTGMFETSWVVAFDLTAESAGIIAGNTNQMKVDLDRIDTTNG